jgi:TonB family protein
MTWWHYLLLSNLYLILFYGFYVLLLQRETFFQLNRIYLVGSALMSFLIPLIQLDWVKQWFITQKVQETIYTASPIMVYRIKAVQPQHITMGEVLSGIYIAGIVILSLKLIWQLFTLSRFIKNSKQVAAAWSFFKKIKVDEQLTNHQVIIAHEEAHARQWHSADVLLIEVIMILNWFNPVVYFYRSSIKHIHEFIADRDALKAGTSKADYALMLLSQTFDAPMHHLLNPFFGSSVLKQRIMMMQKNRSNYGALIKYGFSAPLFVLMLALSSATIDNSQVVRSIKKSAEHIFEAKAPVLADVVTPPARETVKAVSPELITAVQPQFNINTNLVVNDEPHAVGPDALPKTDSLTDNAHHEVFTAVETLPQFPGGVNAFYRFINNNLRYPAEALEKNIKGRVNVTFVVERDGSLSDMKTVANPAAPLAAEALRVMSLSPKWQPGEQNGKRVAVQYTLPIVFTPNGNNTDSTATGQPRKLFFKSYVNTVKLNGDTVYSAAPKIKNLMVVSTKDDKRISPNVIFLVDGKEATREQALVGLSPNKIESISVFKTDANRKVFGKVYDKDVIVIATKK